MSSLRRDQFVRKKELEEARKAGQAPAEVDEHGRDINPHIPKYIASAPWYMNKGVPSLRHQKKLSENDEKKMGETLLHQNKWIAKGESQIIHQSSIYRSGACQNCGSMDHKTKDCCERPRRRGAHLTGEEIAADRRIDPLSNMKLSYDVKRDPWNGYTSRIYREQVVNRHEKLESERKKLHDQQIREKLLKTDDLDDLKQKDGDETIFGTGADQTSRTNSKDLRIREDIPKYLRNLDSNAHYDAKTRSMRENPNPDVPLEELDYAGDNAYRTTGDFREWLETQKFAFELEEKGEKINPAALPSQVEKLHKQLKERKLKLMEENKKSLIDKYGGEEHFKKPKQFGTTAESEYYAEYSKLTGKVVGGTKKILQKSKYDEDQYEHGHSSVWGSYWKDGKWGYACCKLMDRNESCPYALLLIDDSIPETVKRKSENTETEKEYKRMKVE